ncbi:hypothetical protein NDU88_004269 [Pleurodeles waltl]|uniref:Secreted protein n=1 Tax=Pleurodeles waltl TaxID=8319 RepID=A0AAV7W7X1_PLEWA|nr:hypothetical protein NDU88_004269 [Pleurodeles waltl]
MDPPLLIAVLAGAYRHLPSSFTNSVSATSSCRGCQGIAGAAACRYHRASCHGCPGCWGSHSRVLALSPRATRQRRVLRLRALVPVTIQLCVHVYCWKLQKHLGPLLLLGLR